MDESPPVVPAKAETHTPGTIENAGRMGPGSRSQSSLGRDDSAEDPARARRINAAARRAGETQALRWIADMLCLWGLCANAACRRARKCKREPRDCLARTIPLVPEEARDGVAALLDRLRLQLSHDEVRDDAPADLAALEEWRALVEQSAARRAP
jgi:hypothetical protein